MSKRDETHLTKAEVKKIERLAKKLFQAVYDIQAHDLYIGHGAFKLAAEKCQQAGLVGSAAAFTEIAKLYN